MLVASLVLVSALAAAGGESAAGVVVGVTGHVTIESGGASPRSATLGMALGANDVVVLDRGDTASIYIKGGGVVRLHDATRFEMPKAAAAPAQAKLQSGSIAQLESGLWVLNDPAGSLLVSPMRGDAFDPNATAVPLTPRYEVLTQEGAVFAWTGGPAKARVVVAKQREVVWKSDPVAPALVTAMPAKTLEAGQVYTWWLEPESGGAPLTGGIPFRVATPDVIARTKAVQEEIKSLGQETAAYLLLAHYTGASSWTNVLSLANHLPVGDARTRAMTAATQGLRLDETTAAALLDKLGARAKP
jgi:hypothetical protein